MTGFPGHRRAWTQTEGERCRAVLSGEGLLSAPRHTEHTIVWRPRNWTLCKITRPEDKRNEGKRFLPLTEEWEIVISKLGQGTDLHFQLQEWILRLNSRQEEMLGLDTFVFFHLLRATHWKVLWIRWDHLKLKGHTESTNPAGFNSDKRPSAWALQGEWWGSLLIHYK